MLRLEGQRQSGSRLDFFVLRNGPLAAACFYFHLCGFALLCVG